MRKPVSPEIEQEIKTLDEKSKKHGSKMVDKLNFEIALVSLRVQNEILKRIEDRGW
jgi:hypothetical protein